MIFLENKTLEREKMFEKRSLVNKSYWVVFAVVIARFFSVWMRNKQFFFEK